MGLENLKVPDFGEEIPDDIKRGLMRLLVQSYTPYPDGYPIIIGGVEFTREKQKTSQDPDDDRLKP